MSLMDSEAPFQILTIDDERIELLAKELSNETGRKILAELSAGSRTASELARELSLPMPTVLFHIERLVQAGLIEVKAIRPGSRGRVKIYTSSPKAILLITSRSEPREVLKKVYDHFLRSFDRLLRMPVLATALLLAVLTIYAGFHYFSMAGVPKPKEAYAPKRAAEGEKGIIQVTAEKRESMFKMVYLSVLSVFSILLAVKIFSKRLKYRGFMP